MRILICCFPLLWLGWACSPPASAPAVPAYLRAYAEAYQQDPRAANLQWFTEAGYGLFIHYGLYSQLGRGEWVQLTDTIPVAEYALLKETFTAAAFNADSITELMLDAGMKYVTITAKHHDGFCLFQTEQTDFNSVDAANCGRDLIGELYEACTRKGLGLFLYYSYGVDWKHPYAYQHDPAWRGARPAYPEPQPEYRYEKPEDFQRYIAYTHAHLAELLTQYPHIAGIWLDPIMGYYTKPELFPIDSTYRLIRSLSPHALISFKQGANGEEDFRAPERNAGAKVGETWPAALIAAEKNRHKPTEICNTLQNHKWGWTADEDGKHKGPDEVMAILADARAKGANLLLNTGPLPAGAIPDEDKQTLREVGRRLRAE